MMDHWPLNQRDASVADPPLAKDPLRLCVNATVALITCALGPLALLGFAVMGIIGYAGARRAGMLRSRCILGDTRLVLAYLIVLAALAVAAVPFWVKLWMLVLG